MMVNRPIYGTLFAEYWIDERGTGTKELGRCFSVNLRLMYIQYVQMSARGSNVQRFLSELSLLQSLAELLQKTPGVQGFSLSSSICVLEANAKAINIAQKIW